MNDVKDQVYYQIRKQSKNQVMYQVTLYWSYQVRKLSWAPVNDQVGVQVVNQIHFQLEEEDQ